MSDGLLELRRRIRAPVDEVFRWWTEPDRLCEWMTPQGTAEADVDLRVGGKLRVVMRGQGTVIEHTGEFLEVDPPRRLVFTWQSPQTGPQPSVVTVELVPDGDEATNLRLIHAQLPQPAARSHEQGWSTMLDRLVDRLALGALNRHA